MSDVRPFRAIRPRDDLAGEVIAPPYDVLTADEAKALAKNKNCFVRVTRPEATMRKGTDPHGDAAYKKAKKNLAELQKKGTLVQDDEPTFYFYGQQMGDHWQVGVLAGASVAEYDGCCIKKHEFTRPDKEDDRTRHVNALDANTGPVFLTYAADEQINRVIDGIRERPPEYDFTSDDGIGHTLWVVSEPEDIALLAAGSGG